MDRIADPPMDLAAGRSVEVDRVAGHDRDPGDLGRPVALMGDPNELIAQPESADDLGRRRQERDDSHRRMLADGATST